MIYITGDIHGDVSRIMKLNIENYFQKDDIFILLGDVGLNFCLDERDKALKNILSDLDMTFLCIHGNHECRPENIPTYKTKEWHNGVVMYEPEYPNILFAKDGEIYDLEGQKALVCGGAYSVDKYYRFYHFLTSPAGAYKCRNNLAIAEKVYKLINEPIENNKDIKIEIDNIINSKDYSFYWWEDEQPSNETKEKIEKIVKEHSNDIDIVLTHTCPFKYIPTEMLLPNLNPPADNSTEIWLDKIEEKLNYKKWYCGHFHTDKKIDNIQFLFLNLKHLEPFI